MNKIIRILILLIVAVCFSGFEANNSFAQSSSFELDLSMGLEQDSNVTVSDIDLASGLDDIAWFLRAKGSAKFKVSKDVSAKFNYVYSLKDYDEFSQFDQNYHLLTADLAHKIGKTNIGVIGRYLDASLDGDAYLESKQMSPYVSRYFGSVYFLRAFYTYSDRIYKFRPERDGETHAGGLTGYRFLDGTRQYLSLGYRYDDVGAYEEQLAYDRHQLQAEYTRRFLIWQRDTTLKFKMKYESRDYKDINFVIFDERNDDRLTYSASWKVPVLSNAYIEFDVKYRDYNSNLSLVDYNKSVLGVKIGNVF